MLSFIFVFVCSLFEWNQCRFLYRLFISVLQLKIQLLKGKDLDSISRFHVGNVWGWFKPGHGFPTSYVVFSFHVQWVWMRSECSFCWYWWNCWLSLFKLPFSFTNYLYVLMSNWDGSVFLVTLSYEVIANWNVFKNECLPCRFGIFRGLSLSCSVYTCNPLLMELKICKQKSEIERHTNIILMFYL